ncbi:hypothetical protein BDU57DRAFT_555082 [Ampelomyces quisqualis]|uniref:F-box domain-containing protein n=1 Tax=Ampelomyces quisqualis TaxID=50730 RepID=A0A6A5QYN1_AMPQU|nr:hypothetical protein BDU57DRAFT_555082 [Ampelomyces quisqualis]
MGNLWSSQVDEDEEWENDVHYSMESGTFCVMCGNSFDLSGGVCNLNPKDQRYQWLCNYRLLGQIEDMNTHRLTSGHTEPLNTSNINGIFLSERAMFQLAGQADFRLQDESGTDDIWYNALWYSQDSESTLFPLHEACLETSVRALEHLRSRREPTDSEPALKILYHVLNKRFLYRHRAAGQDDFAVNDIFDLRHRSRLYGPCSVMGMNRIEWCGGHYDRFYADPVDINGLDSFIFEVLLSSSSQDKLVEIIPLATAQEPQGIERLPVEILDTICDYLPTQTIVKLHRTSKRMALKLQLDDAFWRRSLTTGSLHAHLWDIDTENMKTFRQPSNVNFSSDDWGWRSVAKLLATKQFPITGRDPRLNGMPPGFWNRCRIWHTIERALDLDYFDKLKREHGDSGIDFRDEIRAGPT